MRRVSPLVALLASAGCSKTTAETWLAGDLHVHSSVASNDTDGRGLPDALGPAMAAAGLDFVFLTDHSNAAGSMHCDDVEDCPNLGPEVAVAEWPAGVVAATEISPIAQLPTSSEPNGHVGCLPLDGVGFTSDGAFVDRPPGAVSGASAVLQCADAGGWTIVNHPFGAAWIQWDWTTSDFDAMEVYNGGGRFAPSDEAALERWEQEGARWVAVGGSDCHRWGTEPPGGALDPALGWPVTWVGVREGEGVLDGLRAGRVVIAEPGTTLAVEARRGATSVGPGESVRGRATMRVTATAVEAGLELQLKEVGGDVLSARVLGDDGAHIELEVGPGLYYARVWPMSDVVFGTGGVALSNAIRVE